MAVIFNDGIMFHKGFGIDDAIPANTRACIDQRMVHDDGSFSNLGMRGDIGQGGLNHRKTRTHLHQIIKKLHASDRGFDLPQRDQDIGKSLDQFR